MHPRPNREVDCFMIDAEALNLAVPEGLKSSNPAGIGDRAKERHVKNGDHHVANVVTQGITTIVMRTLLSSRHFLARRT